MKIPTVCSGSTSTKGTDLSQYSQQYLTKVANEMDNRPRKPLVFRTPAEVMAQKIK